MLVLFLSAIGGCRDPYFPEYEVEDLKPLLIVEGYINVAGTQTAYKLGWARNLDDEESISGNHPVTNAVLRIESEQGDSYQGYQTMLGEYVVPHPVLDTSTKYRLYIDVGTDTYISDYVDVKISPEIGDIEWERNADGVQLYVSTADPSGQSRFYRWEFEEDWRFFAAHESNLLLEGQTFRRRNPDEFTYACFRGERSNDILIFSSEGLSSDVVHRYPFQLIPMYSEKLQSRYSILVKQTVMSKEAFTYWGLIRENSESLGDIFGPMPTEIRGNIRNISNPQEPVIGMVEAIVAAEKRIFIDSQELINPSWAVQNPFYSNCTPVDTLARDVLSFLRDNTSYMVVEGYTDHPTNPIPTRYILSTRECIDCTLRGSLTAPDFWESLY